jgi:lysophospholipase L1-like esterase
MTAIAVALVHAGLRVVLNGSPYTVPGACHGLTDAGTDVQILRYHGVLQGLANGRSILLGDLRLYGVIAAQPSLLSDGIHPTGAGVQVIGRAWAAAFHRYL